jgi:CxC5 like cysteine cluster associated with KDZ transposases/CxC6 like cysteine cluster associated with KDZ transposases
MHFFSFVAPLKCAKNMYQILCLVFWMVFQTLQTLLAFPWSLVLLVGFLPVVSATSKDDPFSGITFRAFSEFVEQHFSSRISLATVLVVLFTMTNNSDVLNLHARQQHPLPNERLQMISGWLKALARALDGKLGQDTRQLFQTNDNLSNLNNDQKNAGIAVKLDSLYKLLDLSPYDDEGTFHKSRCKQIRKEIEPVHVISPISMQCQTQSCKGRSIHINTRDRDIPRATLIKGSKIYEDVHVLSGKCPQCKTIYYADHESSESIDQDGGGNDGGTKVYLNNAKYLKVGQSVWVDRVFSGGVINGIYHFHASSSAFAEFWNATFWSSQKTESRKISRRQIWHTFVQESMRTVAKSSGVTLEMENGIPIEEVTKQAFIQLGDNGIIKCTQNHSCSECTHKYKGTADIITGDDPAAVLGVDENHQVPALVGEGAELAVRDAAQARRNVRLAAQARANADDAMDVDESSQSSSSAEDVDASSQSSSSSEEASPVSLVVMDGVVMGPTHCAFDNCIEAVENARGGVFCARHEITHGNLCRMRDCDRPKVAPTHTCTIHKNRWHQHAIRYGRQSVLGIRRLIRRSEEEHVDWLPQRNRQVQPHDEDPDSENRKDNYFVPPRFYCVETICAPCGAVHAWTLFDKSESPTHILNFLEAVYPTADVRPDYVCIDKGCQVLRTAISNGSWNVWKETTRFIVDSYHYINHRTNDYLCRKWCNPAPLNGSAPNLVVVEHDVNGNAHYKRAFNTQVCLVISFELTTC